MRMSKYILYVVFIITYFSSCKDEKQQWLNKYAEIKCAYITDTVSRANDKKAVAKAFIIEKEAAEKSLLKANSGYRTEIKLLEEKIKTENSEYLKKYRAESDRQSDMYGHFSTPAYEKKIYSLKVNSAKNVDAFNQQIEQIKLRRDADNDYKRCLGDLQKITKAVSEKDRLIDSQYENSIDSLQKLLNQQNAKFTEIAANLTGSELKDFTLRRDNLKENPCIK